MELSDEQLEALAAKIVEHWQANPRPLPTVLPYPVYIDPRWYQQYYVPSSPNTYRLWNAVNVA